MDTAIAEQQQQQQQQQQLQFGNRAGLTKIFYAIETFGAQLGAGLVPYLDQLMEKLFLLLSITNVCRFTCIHVLLLHVPSTHILPPPHPSPPSILGTTTHLTLVVTDIYCNSLIEHRILIRSEIVHLELPIPLATCY